MAQLNFDANSVPPSTGQMDPVPAGWYNVMIDESELKPTKDAQGTYLQLRFAVLDGQFVGRKLFARLNLRNNNPVAQEIAFKDLSAIAHAVGVLHVQDSQQLHGIPLKVKVKVSAREGYDPSNDITAYRNVNEQVSGGGAAAAPVAPAPAAPAGWGAPPVAGPAAPAPSQWAAPAPVAAPVHAAPPTAPQAAAPQPWSQPAPQEQAPLAPPAAQGWQPPAAAAPAAPAADPATAAPPWARQ